MRRPDARPRNLPEISAYLMGEVHVNLPLLTILSTISPCENMSRNQMDQYYEIRLAALYSLVLKNDVWKTYGCEDFDSEMVDFSEGNRMSN